MIDRKNIIKTSYESYEKKPKIKCYMDYTRAFEIINICDNGHVVL